MILPTPGCIEKIRWSPSRGSRGCIGFGDFLPNSGETCGKDNGTQKRYVGFIVGNKMTFCYPNPNHIDLPIPCKMTTMGYLRGLGYSSPCFQLPVAFFCSDPLATMIITGSPTLGVWALNPKPHTFLKPCD